MLKPKCMPGSKISTGIYYNSEGFLLPCCWLDMINKTSVDELKALGMYDEELKLSNNNKVEDIINSDQWKNFRKILKHNPQCALQRCKDMCGK